MEVSEALKCQKVYRSLLHCMSRPGEIKKIEAWDALPGVSLSPYSLSVARTLLDGEVTFYLAEADPKSEKMLNIFTTSEKASLEEADYIWTTCGENLAVSKLKKGSFEYPDNSATILCEVEEISDTLRDGAMNLTLRGPGIEEINLVSIKGITKNLLEQRQNSIEEYPLGINFIFIDRTGTVCCLPRSTNVDWEGETDGI